VASVLVVDDERDICELIRVNLEFDGHDVVCAADGEAGLAALAADRPDAIILDIMMPGRDGFSILEVLKATEATATIPVIMLTARVEAMDRLRGGIEGAVRYVTKPFSVVGVRGALAEVLAGEHEPVARRRAQTDALVELARLEAGRPVPPAGSARPRLTRYEVVAPAPQHDPEAPPQPVTSQLRRGLSARQNELLDAVVSAPDLRTAAEDLGVTRTYLYAGMRRIAHRVGLSSGPELVRALRLDLDNES
jgi:CheY-like chemotaxis protein